MKTTAVIRASSFWSLLDCAHRWEGIHLLDMWKPSSAPAAIGTAVHASTAELDRSRMDGDDYRSSHAIERAIDSIHNPKEPVDWGEISQGKAEVIATRCHHAYETQVAPTRDYAEVELTLKPFEIQLDDVTLTVTGTLDRVRMKGGKRGVSDIKSGRSAVSKGAAVVGKHAAQVGIYDLIYSNTVGPLELPPELIGLQTTSQVAVGTADVPNARTSLIGTADSPGLLEYVANYFRTGLFPPNPSSMLCSERYCPRWDRCIHKG